MSEQDQDRSQEATPHKLKEAKKRGQVAKSPDVTSAIVFTTAVTFLYWRGWESVRDQFRLAESLLAMAGQIQLTEASVFRLGRFILDGTLGVLGPFFAAMMLAAVVSNLIQTGMILSAEPIKPDLNRINPATGFKKIFSARTVFDLLRSCLKLVLLGSVAYMAVGSLVPKFFAISGLSPIGYLRTLLDAIAGFGMKVALMLALIALVDLIYNRRDFAKKMRMSKREVTEEIKQREGNPRIRARLRQLRQEMRKRSMAASHTKDADVLITNPTHIAIALKYEHGMSSPQLIAKGAGTLAAQMRMVAARHRIPVVQNRTLARKLFHTVDFGHHVPGELYADVAKIIVWVLAMRRGQDGRRVSGTPAEGNT